MKHKQYKNLKIQNIFTRAKECIFFVDLHKLYIKVWICWLDRCWRTTRTCTAPRRSGRRWVVSWCATGARRRRHRRRGAAPLCARRPSSGWARAWAKRRPCTRWWATRWPGAARAFSGGARRPPATRQSSTSNPLARVLQRAESRRAALIERCTRRERPSVRRNETLWTCSLRWHALKRFLSGGSVCGSENSTTQSFATNYIPCKLTFIKFEFYCTPSFSHFTYSWSSSTLIVFLFLVISKFWWICVLDGCWL